MTTVRLSGKLPRGTHNGLAGEIAEAFEDDPKAVRVVVALMEVKSLTQDLDAADTIVTLRVRRIEAIGRDEDQRAMKRIMMRANEERSGQTVLPFDTENEIDAFFGQWATEPPPKPEKPTRADPQADAWQETDKPGLHAVDDPDEE